MEIFTYFVALMKKECLLRAVVLEFPSMEVVVGLIAVTAKIRGNVLI